MQSSLIMSAHRPFTDAERFVGTNVVLRRVTMDDVGERYLSWLLDPVVNRYLETRWSPQSIATIQAFVTAQRAATDSHLLAIEHAGQHIGNLKIGPIHPRHRYADISYFIGDQRCWGKGLATAAIRVAVQIAFTRLDLHRVQAGVYAGNVGSCKALLKAGFRAEGIWKNQLLGPAGWEDHAWFGLLREDVNQVPL